MAAISAAAPTRAAAAPVPKRSTAVSSPAVGLGQLGRRRGAGRLIRCSWEAKRRSAVVTLAGTGASLLAAASVMTVSNPVLALVDERMSTEGIGLSLGISNNLLGWILLGVFGLIWSLYFLYTSTLEEDDDSALSL